MTKVDLKQVLAILKPTYRSIDLRVATVRMDKKWRNVATALRFSRLSQNELRKHQNGIKSQKGECSTLNFKVLFKSSPMKDMKELLKGLGAGEYRLGGIQLTSRKAKDIMSSQSGGNLHLEREDNWPLYEFNPTPTGDRVQTADLLDGVLGEVRKFSGYQSPVSAVRELLSMNYEPSYDLECSIGLPLYASMHGPYWRSGQVYCRLLSHKGLTNLKLDVFVKKDQGKKVRSRESFQVDDIQGQVSKTHIVDREVCHDAGTAVRKDSVQCKLYSLELPETYLLEVEDHVYALIEREQYRQPFPRTVFRFCSKERLRDMLLNPHETRTKKHKDPAEIFERAVSWLLSLYDHPNIRLEEYEHLKARTTSAKHDSIDIVAFVNYPTDRALVLACCTIGTPNESDFTRARNTAKKLMEDVPESENEIVSIVFLTPIDAAPMKELAKAEGMKIIDGPIIEELLDGLEKSQYRRFSDELRK